MLKSKSFFIFVILLGSAFAGVAQVGELEPSPVAQPNKEEVTQLSKKNYLKLNVTSLILKNYSLQYERVLTKNISAAISGRYMPASNIPFKSLIKGELADGDPDVEKIIDEFELGNFSFTPEVKFYLGKGYGQGFYISLFYRYAQFNSSGIPIDFETDLGENKTLHLSGDLSAHTGGFMLGLQKNIGKSMCLDFWFLGPHIGSAKGTFTALPSSPLTPQEQQEIRDAIEDLDLPVVNTYADVNANWVSLRADGPWAGVRIGVTFGIRF